MKKRMKIFQIITLSELGGAQSVVLNLANNLARDHDVYVIAGGDGPMWDQLDTRIKKIKIKYLKRSISPLDFFVWIKLIWLGMCYRPNIVHLHSSKIGILGRMAFRSKKTVYTVHGFDSIRKAHRKFLPLEKKLQKQCKAIIGVSKYDELGMRNEGITHKVSCVYNGIPIPIPLSENPFKCYDSYKYKILCIARLSPPKRADLFIKTASLLKDYAFIWIGNQDEYIGEKTDNVFFLGNIPNAGAFCKYADLLILPSNYEGLPIVIIEAMSFGLPIVASDVGGISEIVLNGQNGYTVNNEPKEFSSKIELILENNEIYNRYSKESMAIFRENLTIEKMVSKYLKIYNN